MKESGEGDKEETSAPTAQKDVHQKRVAKGGESGDQIEDGEEGGEEDYEAEEEEGEDDDEEEEEEDQPSGDSGVGSSYSGEFYSNYFDRDNIRSFMIGKYHSVVNSFLFVFLLSRECYIYIPKHVFVLIFLLSNRSH